ncbi:MAG: helix-turn-helix domain-containing protein [Rubricoccaceae bacterium]|nr:helix-turn-helix domain-containing protein [Rubricoccaceae bacterium]
MNDFITTAEAAKIAGVGVSSIKRWADQSVIKAIRTPGGHRRIIKSDLLRFIEESRTETPDTVRSSRARQNHFGGNNETFQPTRSTSSNVANVWADDILAGDVHEIQASLLDARARHGSWFPTSDEVGLGLTEIGRRWTSGEISVLDEHVASERLSRALAIITQTMPLQPNAPKCVLACIGNEAHTLALSLLQVCLPEVGYRPLWVGANTPVEYACMATEKDDVRILALSASQASFDENELASIARHVGKCCRASNTELVVGGGGAWPNDLDYGFRFHSFSAFAAHLQSIRGGSL